MSKLLRILHQELVEQYGERYMASFDDAHPIMRKILDECSGQPYRDKRYNEFIASASRMTKIEPEKLKNLVSPKKFYELMASCAAGIQYTQSKVSAPIKIDDYQLSGVLLDENMQPFHDFAMAIGHFKDKYELVINPTFILEEILNENDGKAIAFEYKNCKAREGNYNLNEVLTLIAAEEALHCYQMQHANLSPTYSLNKLDNYHNDPMEKEADVFQDVVARELGLGSQNRGAWRA